MIKYLSSTVWVVAAMLFASQLPSTAYGQLVESSELGFMEGVDSWVITSEASEREYQISVALPFGYADSTKSYPILFATDANGHFGMVVETARMLRIANPQIPQIIIVGIGYTSGGRQIHARPYRGYDLFPTRDLSHEQIRGIPYGGGAQFLTFLIEELVPAIDSHYRSDPEDRAIYGHSAGGFFALYALFEGRGTFQKFISASPSLWWDFDLMFRIEDEYARSDKSLPGKAFIAMGENEPNFQRDDSSCCLMVTKFHQFVNVLDGRTYSDLEWTSHLFEGENHQSVVPAAISRGLRYIYDSPR